ncbi:MAG: fused MFS/spermidine synthase [Pyrinomonadaceae bacterium]
MSNTYSNNIGASENVAVDETQNSYSTLTITLIATCFVVSGATGLIYEVVWVRMLGLVFGATTLAISTVLSAFMGGLALGSAIAGRLGARIKAPFRFYGLMEIIIAGYALALPLLFRGLDDAYVSIWQQIHPSFFWFGVWRFVLSGLLLLIPTTLMGATLPVLSVAFLRQDTTNKSNAVATLYACNLAGAIAGATIAGFLFLPTLGIRNTIIVSAAVNVLIGIVAVVSERSSHVQKDFTAPDDSHVDVGAAAHKFWLMCAIASGFVTISSQIAWTRSLTMIIGSSTYAFSIVVAMFLIGLAGGAWLIARKAFEARRMVVTVELATAAGLLFSLYVTNWTPLLLVKLGLGIGFSSWGSLLALQILCAAVMILAPALLMGMVMPLVLVWAGNHSVVLVGRSYALNTLGAILGAVVTGFVLIPKTTTRNTLLICAMICLIVAGVAYEPRPTVRDPQLRRSIGTGVTAALVLILFVLAPRMNVVDLSIGAYDSLVRVLAQTREGVQEKSDAAPVSEQHKLLMYDEGSTATVSVRRDQDVISMAINGRTNASDSQFDMPTQVMLGQLPLLIASANRKALVIGFATGITVGAMLQSPIEEVTCLELEGATIAGSRFFEHVNNHPLNDIRFHLIIDDARTYLRVAPNLYDMIISEPSHPWVPGVANLFTKEFFEIGRDRLEDNGVFVQWVQIYQLSTDSLRSVLATYLNVFPHVLVFRVRGASRGKDLLLVGSRHPLTLDRLAERLGDARVRAELARVGLMTEADVRSWYVTDEAKLGPAVAGAIINTDDNMHIETTVPREAFRPLMRSNEDWIEQLAH